MHRCAVTTAGSQPRSGGLYRLLKAEHAFGVGFAFVNLAAAGQVKLVQVAPAKGDGGKPGAFGLADDAVDTPGLVADLDAHFRGDIKPALRVNGHAVGAALHLTVRQMEIVITLLGGEGAVGLDLKGVNKLSLGIGN